MDQQTVEDDLAERMMLAAFELLRRMPEQTALEVLLRAHPPASGVH